MVTWEEANKCKINKKKTHLFSIKYKKYKYCYYCGECQAWGMPKISEDLLEYLKEEECVKSGKSE